METHTPKSLPPPPEGFRIVTDVNEDGSLKVPSDIGTHDISLFVVDGGWITHWPYCGAIGGPWAVRIGSEIDRLNTFEPSLPPGLPLPSLPEGFKGWAVIPESKCSYSYRPQYCYYRYSGHWSPNIDDGGLPIDTVFLPGITYIEAIPVTPDDVFGPEMGEAIPATPSVGDGLSSAEVIDDGGPFSGISVRLWLAGQVMPAIYSNGLRGDEAANEAFDLVDALIAADKRKEDGV